jgi:four helix bundle protein
MTNNPIKLKSYSLAIRIVELYKRLSGERKEFVLSKQIRKSGTSVGANIREAIQAESKADSFIRCVLPSRKALRPSIGLSF